MGQTDEILEQKLGEILLEGKVEDDHYKELYWASQSGGSVDSRALVLASGPEAVATLREAMMMIRSDEQVYHNMVFYKNGDTTKVIPQTGFDAPDVDLSKQRDPDLDAMLSIISDMARTYPDSPEEQRAIHEAQSVVAMPDEKIAKIMQAVLILADACGVSIKDISRYLATRSRPAWVLRHLSDETVKHL